MLRSLQRPVSSSFPHIFLILSGSCNHVGSGRWRWILIMRTRLLILSNSRRPFRSMWSTNTVPNVNECMSLNPKMFHTVLSCLLNRLLDFINCLLIHMICPTMMKTTGHLTVYLKRHPDEAFMQQAYEKPQGFIRIHRLSYHRTGVKLIQIIMIATLNT